MKTNFKEIFDKIKHKLNMNIECSYGGDDFISDIISYRVTIKIPNTKYKFYNIVKLSEAFLTSARFNILQYTVDKLELDTAKHVWRLNDKRIRHNLKSWI